MGGLGSGDYYRWSKRTTKEELRRIDIRYMRKAGLLLPNHQGTLSWNCNGEPSGEIGYTMRKDKMVVNYALEKSGSESESVEQTIPISRTSCNFGGGRAWLHCPLCQTRVAILYMVYGLFRCRHCHNVPYSSQQEGYLDRMCRKATKIRKRLYGDDDEYGFFALSEPLFLRPKGMHRKTFGRLKQVENRAQNEIEGIMVSRWGHGWY